MALESQPRTGVCFAGAVLSELDATRTGGTLIGMDQLLEPPWYATRMPGDVGGAGL